jgi:hypothetical protein
MDRKVNWPTSDPLFPKHLTDYNIAKFSLIPRPEEWPEIYSEDANDFYSERYLEEVARRAQLIGGIRLYDLVFIMAKSESHNEILPELWNYSGFNKGIGEFPKWDSSMAENEWSRAHVWYWLLWRWTIYEKFCGSDERKSYYFAEIAEKCPIPRLNLYEYKNDDEIFEKLDNTKEQTVSQCFKLEEFAQYLKDTIEKNYFGGALSVRLPEILYPAKYIIDPEEPDKYRKRRYHNQVEQARAIAEPMLINNGKTISWIIRNHLMKKVLKPDGTPFGKKTYRDWIKDLRPGYTPKSTRHN